MTVIEIVEQYLKANNLDGLYHEDGECACECGELAPCGQVEMGCRGGVKAPCECGDHDYHIVEAVRTER